MPVRFLAIDGFNLVRRIYEARRPDRARDAEALVATVTASVQRALHTHAPTHAALVLEHHDRTWRHLLYPGYKAARTETPATLLTALPAITDALVTLGVGHCSARNYEADDVIASIAAAMTGHGGSIVILSTDRIFLQLLGPQVSVYDHFAERFLDAGYVVSKYGVEPSQLRDWLALTGDPGNSIRGVPGVGRKTAAALLAEYGDLDTLLAAAADALAAGDLKGPLVRVGREHDEAVRCRQLVSLKSDVELGLNLRDFRVA